MKATSESRLRFVLLKFFAVTLLVSLIALDACDQTSGSVAADNDDIAGVVTGPNGAEAGVWVIAKRLIYRRATPRLLLRTMTVTM